jgi:hypothetical protein
MDKELIKFKCLEFAIELHRHGIYKPEEVKAFAEKLFEWITNHVKHDG